ncbi:hypothetical protein [Terrisporobacter mayombei]|uniref:Uncharacterized protein n=1 Tax=Terrisporobacter mayombei TaxID=1541 RepID=A0ABY9PZP7_9FIRM|nr:hypothetical protein [Terrisporobacter mayombei]MCC3868650.1 hypothetical protein [Terrisporobacter mayombei]WMT80806.1 hypothetical protein TEMA_11280 [Terrisporobacter mayombei]
MRDRRRLEQNKRSNNKHQKRRGISKNSKSKKKIKEKKNIKEILRNKIININISWTLIIISLFLGMQIGFFTDFNIKDLIEDISKYRISIVKEDDQSEESETDKKNNQPKSDEINKAKKAIVNSCGSEFKDVDYSEEGEHPTKGKGEYYIFKMGKEATGNMMFYVDKNTYEVFEYSVGGYFGEYRRGRYSPLANENK